MNEKIKKPMSPTRVIIGSFVLIILIGTFLLWLPVSAKSGEFTNLVDALFTATTATCVTGLVTVDTFTHWSVFGQGVILVLIQVGGLGLVTLTTFFMVALRKKAGLSSMTLAREAVNGNDLSSLKRLIGLVIVFSFTVELIGAMILSVRFVPQFGAGEGIWVSVFTAVSAFCNAGIDLFGQLEPFSSVTHYATDPLVCFTIMGLIVIGGLGFIVYYDILFARKSRGHSMLHTKIVLAATLALLLGGTVLFLIFEWNNPATIGGIEGVGNKLMSGLFQSVTTRTAGYNTFSMADMTEQSKLLSAILMFIGAAPGSTAGGVKVTTMVVIAATVISTLRGSDEVIVMKRKIDSKTVYKAVALVVIGMLVATVSTAIVYITNDIQLIDAVFETFSAIGTVGLTAGATPTLSIVSKLTLILTMLLGRVGPFTFFIAFSGKSDKSKAVILPEGQIVVG